MSNLFDDVMGNLDNVQQKLLGPNYAYWKQVKMPSEMGMSSEGKLSTLAKNVGGLIGYVEVLVSGGGRASKTDGPMGNKFFLKTGAKCKDKQTGQKVDRFVYINNVPDGQIPFISQGLGGTTFPNFRGLVPGALGSLNVLNPFAILQSFMSGTNPECQALTMETIDADNNKSRQTNYVSTTDIKNMNPCWFENERNPVTNATCRKAFKNMMNDEEKLLKNIPDDMISTLFLTGVSGLSLYILYRLIVKQQNK